MRKSTSLANEQQKPTANAKDANANRRRVSESSYLDDGAEDTYDRSHDRGEGDRRSSIDKNKQLDEALYLANRNAFLSNELAKIQDKERRCAKDPRLIDKHNEIALLQKEINDVYVEIDTLRVVKRRQDASLRKIEESNENMRREKGNQNSVNNELRIQLNKLQKQLREAQKASVDAHNRFGALQEIIKANVSRRQADKLRRNIKQQVDEINELLQTKARLQSEYETLRTGDIEHEIQTKKNAARRKHMAGLHRTEDDSEMLKLPRRRMTQNSFMQLQSQPRSTKLPPIH